MAIKTINYDETDREIIKALSEAVQECEVERCNKAKQFRQSLAVNIRPQGELRQLSQFKVETRQLGRANEER